MKILIEESVLRQALDALSYAIQNDSQFDGLVDEGLVMAKNGLESALDAAEKVDPVAWIHRHKAYPTKVDDLAPGYYGSAWSHEPLYTHPSTD